MIDAQRKRQIRERALRAAAGVALFTGALACGGEAPQVGLEEGQSQTQTVVDGGLVDAGLADAGLVDAGTLADCPDQEVDFSAWNQCCWDTVEASGEEINWETVPCIAWGPPVPPTMEVA